VGHRSVTAGIHLALTPKTEDIEGLVPAGTNGGQQSRQSQRPQHTRDLQTTIGQIEDLHLASGCLTTAAHPQDTDVRPLSAAPTSCGACRTAVPGERLEACVACLRSTSMHRSMARRLGRPMKPRAEGRCSAAR